jgi:2-methylcitrate dehydratase PrpD
LLAACEEGGADGQRAITAFVAATEIMLRIACATHHSPEKIGFHAPGLTGAYGAAVAAGVVMGLDEAQLTNALGIAGSLSSGLLAFSKSTQGAMVKRLHLGRASESGILAARLASEGYEGPETILEGKFGFLDAYCKKEDIEPALLTAKLGEEWEVMRICLKRYACHINAHTPVQAMRDLMAEHRFAAADVAKAHITGSERLATHHNIREPGDIMQSQYSVPFCVAVALHRDPEDPKSFAGGALEDPAIRATCRNIESSTWTEPGKGVRASRITVTLKDGRVLARDGNTYKGMPADPLTREDLKRKFMLLCADMEAGAAEDIFARWAKLESQAHVTI